MAPDAPFMADQLPSVNFNFEDLRERMARFTARFDKFIDEGRKRVLEEKNQFRINLTELHGMDVPISSLVTASKWLTAHTQRTKNKHPAPSRSKL
jgi:kinetochore protein Spc25